MRVRLLSFCFVKRKIRLNSGLWRVISKATSKKDGHIHRLTTKDIERIHRQDVRNERQTPRSYICIRDIEAFELIMRNNGKKKNELIQHDMTNIFVICFSSFRSSHYQWSTY